MGKSLETLDKQSLKEDVARWWHLLNYDKMSKLSDEYFEKVFLDR